jgi:hypothetical protein
MTRASVLAVPCRTLSALVGTLVPALCRGPGALRVHRTGVPAQEVAHPDHRLPDRRPRAHHNGLRMRVPVNVPQWSTLLSLLWWSQVRSEQSAGIVTPSHRPERRHTGHSVTDRGVDCPPVELGQPCRSLPTTFRETAERTPERHIQCRHKTPQMTRASVLAVPCRTLSALVGTLVPALCRGPGALSDASHRLQGPSRRRPRPGSSAPGSSPAWPPPTCTSHWPACARPGKCTAMVDAAVVAATVAGLVAVRRRCRPGACAQRASDPKSA